MRHRQENRGGRGEAVRCRSVRWLGRDRDIADGKWGRIEGRL